MPQHLRKALADRREDGASAVEYGLLVAAIAALIVVIVFSLGGIIRGVFKNTCDEVSTRASVTTGSCDQ